MLKKRMRITAVVIAVSLLFGNAFGNRILSYANQERPEFASETEGKGAEALQSQDIQGNGADFQSQDVQGDVQNPQDQGIQGGTEGSQNIQGGVEGSQEKDIQGDPEDTQDAGGQGNPQDADGQGTSQDADGQGNVESPQDVEQEKDGTSQENTGEDNGNEGDLQEYGEAEGQAALEESFAEIVKEYDMYAMLANGQKFQIRQMPTETAAVQHTLPSGYQVKLTGAVADGAAVWFQVEYAIQDAVYSGYIQEMYVVTQDERLQQWKAIQQKQQSTYGIRESVRAAAGNTDLSAFPKSYQSYIKKLAAAHPNWTFVPMNTGLDWKEVLVNENGDKVNLVDGSDPSTLVTWKSTNASAYNISTGKWVVKEGSTWVQASESIIKYYMDPRNFLNEDSVFQFEQLTYNSSYHTVSGVEKVLSGTFMSNKKLEDGSGGGITYAQAFVKIGQELKVSPFFLASRVRQEQGVNGNSALISGTYPGYKGYYNYFNRRATGIGEAVIINGLEEAKSNGWNTRYKALLGGAESVSADFITKGQDTLYLQKFDVDASYNGLYWHQYMQNLLAADNEGKSVRRSYTEMGTINNSFVFKVPVYNNMPSSACGKPGETLKKTTLSAAKSGDTSVKLSWKEIPGAVGYQVYRAAGTGGYTKLKTVNGLENTVLEDTNAAPGKQYTYKVRGFLKLYGGNMKSPMSATKTVDFGVAQTSWKSLKMKNYTTAALSWNKASVTGYRIYRKTDNGKYVVLKTISDRNKVSYSDKSVAPGHTYTYRIRCYNKVNGVNYFSRYTGTKSLQIKMTASSLTKAVPSGGSKVKLTWEKDAKAQGYQIYRATSPKGKYTRIKSVKDPAKLSWSDSSVSADKTYYYKIRSYVKTTEGTKASGFSEVLSVSTALTNPVFTAVRGTSKGIKLTWKKIKSAWGYKIYRSSSKKGTYKEVKRVSKNATVAWTDKNVSKGKTYYYKIKAFSHYGSKSQFSSYSKAVSAKF